jgi:hypothetical protein
MNPYTVRRQEKRLGEPIDRPSELRAVQPRRITVSSESRRALEEVEPLAVLAQKDIYCQDLLAAMSGREVPGLLPRGGKAQCGGDQCSSYAPAVLHKSGRRDNRAGRDSAGGAARALRNHPAYR